MLIRLTIFLVAVLLFFGLKTICAVLATKERSYVGRHTLSMMAKWQRRQFDAWTAPPLKQLLPVATRLAYLDETTATRLNNSLFKAGVKITPQEYIAKKHLVIALGICMMAVCFVLRFYLGIFVGIFAMVYALMKQRDILNVKIRKKELIISQEMPRFVRSICRSLQNDRDLYNVISSYRKVAGQELGGELDILLAEMKSGNVQSALVHFDNRLGMPEVFRLCGALHDMSIGIDQTVTLGYLADDMARQTKESIRKELSLKPGKMRRTYYPAIGICIAMIMYVLVVYVINNFTNLF